MIVASLLMWGCGTNESAGSSDPVTFSDTDDDEFFLFPEPEARDGSRESDVVLDWMDRELDLIQREQLSAPVAARLLAYTALAIDSAVALADRTDTLAVRGLELPAGPPEQRDAAVAATVAAAAVTQALVPTPAARRQAELLEQQHLERRSSQSIKDIDPSIELGRAVAAAVVDRAANDGYDTISTDLERQDDGPGIWEATPSGYGVPVEPEWGMLDPLVVTADDCPVRDPVPFSEEPDSPFWEQVMVPYEASSAITDEERQIVRHWSDRNGLTFTPAGHWVHILGEQTDANQQVRDVTLHESARRFAVLSMVQSDAMIATFKAKYRIMLERPVTYVQRLLEPGWLPVLQTPPHPEYPSGHSTGSAAAASVLAAMLGERPFTDTVHDRIGWNPRSYASFAEASKEASMSRIYGGIHYPMATEAGAEMGACLASTALDRLMVAGSGG